MIMTNIQQISLDKPLEEERDIFLTLFCVRCKTFKNFKITQSLKNLLVRNSKKIKYCSKCECCGNEIVSEISWGMNNGI